MTLYMFTALLIVLPGLLYKPRPMLIDGANWKQKKKRDNHFTIAVSKEDVHIFAVSILLIFIMANRGYYSADAESYQAIFNKSFNIQNLSDFIGHSRIEVGYVLLNKIVSIFTKDYYWMQVVNTLLTIIPVVYISRRTSCAWYSLFLYFIFGTYFQAFNVVRQMLAISILYLGIEGIYSGNLKKFFAATIVATFIHKISLVMIPMYFIIRLSKRKMKWWQYVLIYLVLSGAIVTLASGYFESQTVEFNKTLGGYGKSIYYVSMIFLLLEIFMYLRVRKSLVVGSYDATAVNISLAGSLMFCMCFILSTQVTYAIRLTGYFLPFIMIGFPKLVSMQNSLRDRQIIMLGTCLFGLLYFAQATGAQEWISRW